MLEGEPWFNKREQMESEIEVYYSSPGGGTLHTWRDESKQGQTESGTGPGTHTCIRICV